MLFSNLTTDGQITTKKIDSSLDSQRLMILALFDYKSYRTSSSSMRLLDKY